MDVRETNIQNSFISMTAFNDENEVDYAEFPDAKAAFTIIRTSKETITNYAATQASGERRRAVQKKSVLFAAIKRKLMSNAKTARGLNFEDEGFRRLFNVPNGKGEQKMLAAAREHVTQTTKYKADFLRRGQKADFIEKLSRDIADYEQAMTEKAGAQGAGVGATAGIDEAIENGLEAREIADSILQVVYEDNPVKLAEWTRAKHVKRTPKREETVAEEVK